MGEPEQQLTHFPKFLSRKQVCAVVGVTYPALWGWIKAGHFPPGLKLGIGQGNRNKIVWLESEVLQLDDNQAKAAAQGHGHGLWPAL